LLLAADPDFTAAGWGPNVFGVQIKVTPFLPSKLKSELSLALLSAINVREKKYCFVRMQRFVDQKSGKWPGAFWAP
jgi:hypothetical protein